MQKIDWDSLIDAATDAMHKAYAPYSKYPVGAAAIADDGRLITGCNVENASLGLGTCAENALICELFRTGGGRLIAFVAVNKDGEVLMPCGRCRQLLFEHGGSELVVKMPSGITTMAQVLPDAFGPQHLQ